MLNLPAISQSHAIAVVDGECALCSKSAQFIARADKTNRVRITPSQSPLGKALMEAAGLDADDPTSWLVLDHGVIHTELDAVIHLGNILGGVGRLANLMRVLPQVWRNAVYRVVARNRIAWFGTADLCALPNAQLKAKILTDL